MSNLTEAQTDLRFGADASGEAAARVVLKPRKSQPFFGRHPWVFQGAIQHIDGDFVDGDVVDLLTDKENFIARGIINSQSKLRIRLYTWDKSELLDASFWRRRLERAITVRHEQGLIAADRACRLVFSESDGFSGLIVDKYGEHIAAQLNALAMAARWPMLQQHLVDVCKPASITVRNDKSVLKEEGMEPLHGLVWGKGPDGPVFVFEHGIKFGVDLAAGQKTGLYLDQVENHRVVAGYLRGRRVLDLFCYTGGFSIAASMLGGASDVLGIDGSQRAIATARANAELNRVENARFEIQDVFEALDAMVARGERFGAVILDPPKFARGRGQVDEALRAYYRINRVAVDLLQPGGILVTCSCSGGVARNDFLAMLSGVAQKSGRDIQVLEQRGAAGDHPVSVTCHESEYLKCFICRVA